MLEKLAAAVEAVVELEATGVELDLVTVVGTANELAAAAVELEAAGEELDLVPADVGIA